MMSQFCSKFWGLLSPPHSDSSQGGQEGGVVGGGGGGETRQEMEQKLAQPHSGRKTGGCLQSRLHPHHPSPHSSPSHSVSIFFPSFILTTLTFLHCFCFFFSFNFGNWKLW